MTGIDADFLDLGGGFPGGGFPGGGATLVMPLGADANQPVAQTHGPLLDDSLFLCCGAYVVA
jgi:hypothetical protein